MRTKQTARRTTTDANLPSRDVVDAVVEPDSDDDIDPELLEEYEYDDEDDDDDDNDDGDDNDGEGRARKAYSFKADVALLDAIDRRAVGAPKSIEEIRVGLWRLPDIVEPQSVDACDKQPDFDALVEAAHRARIRAGIRRKAPLLVSEIMAQAKRWNAERVWAPIFAPLKHGSQIVSMDYRGCGHFIVEAVHDDFLLHARHGEYGYAPPVFFFDLPPMLDNFDQREYGEFFIFADFATREAWDEQVAQLFAQHGTVSVPPHAPFKLIMHGDDFGAEAGDVRKQPSEVRLAFARIWLTRVGRKERARRVARVIVHKLLGSGGWGLAHLVCDMIADWVVEAG